MAEFQEVIRQAERICDMHHECIECPLHNKCVLPVQSYANQDFEEMEAVVMQWASEHPEPQYPTWEEWQEADYPNARFPISLCHFIKGSICPRPMNPLLGSCVECRKQPIPADIAEKLGIKPREQKND